MSNLVADFVDTLTGQRSVYKRIERIAALMKDDKFTEESDSPYGLPKVRTVYSSSGKISSSKYLSQFFARSRQRAMRSRTHFVVWTSQLLQLSNVVISLSRQASQTGFLFLKRLS